MGLVLVERDDVGRLDKYAEVRIEVRLPASSTDNGEPIVYTYSQLVPPEAIRVHDHRAHVPPMLRHAARSILLSLQLK